jgi:hypothetical protein
LHACHGGGDRPQALDGAGIIDRLNRRSGSAKLAQMPILTINACPRPMALRDYPWCWLETSMESGWLGAEWHRRCAN